MKTHAPLPLLLLHLALCSFLCSGDGTPNFACDVAVNPALAAFGFCNASWEHVARAGDLVQRLSLPEKIGFLGHVTVAVPRLGIPSYNWWSEALHGVAYTWATSFPQVILTAASFNITLFRAIGEVSEIDEYPSYMTFLTNAFLIILLCVYMYISIGGVD